MKGSLQGTSQRDLPRGSPEGDPPKGTPKGIPPNWISQRDLPKGSPKGIPQREPAKGSPKGISPKEYPKSSTNCFKQLSLLLPSPIINTDPKLFGTYQRIGSVPSLWGDPFGRSLWGPTGSHKVRMESHGNAISPHRIPWDFMESPPAPSSPPPLRRPPCLSYVVRFDTWAL